MGNPVLGNAVVSERLLDADPVSVQKILRGLGYIIFEENKKFLRAARRGVIEFNSTVDWFDVERFRKIQPIFAFCVGFYKVIFAFELVVMKAAHR